MKSKSKILHLVALLGCSIFCVNAAATELKECSVDGKGAVTSNDPCILDKLIYESKKAVTVEQNYYYSSKGAKIESNSNESAAFGYSCINGENSKLSCTLINTTGLYEAASVGTNYYYNVYKNSNNGLSYQLIKYVIKSDSIAYKSSGASSLDNAIILCSNDECKRITPKEGDVFIDASPVNTSNNAVGVIKCSSSSCNSSGELSEPAVFLNAGNEDKPLIKCDNSTNKAGPIICTSQQAGNNEEYYVNGASSKSVIYCSGSGSCESYIPEGNSYFVNTVNAPQTELISCSGSCSAQGAIDNGYYLTRPKGAENQDVIKCTGTSPITCSIVNNKDSNGYYQNADDNTKATHPLISCDSKNGCKSLKLGQDILPGYYVDVSVDGSPVVLVCTENACNDLSSSSSTNTYTDPNIKGNYNFDKTSINLQFIIDPSKEDEDKYSASVSSTSNEEALYYFIEISNSHGFPGISSTVTTLFKVSKYYIARVVSDGIIYVSDTENKITDSGTPGSGTTIYSCSKSKKTCVLTQSCNIGNYFLDSDNNIGYNCNNKGNIERIDNPGYYVDSGVTGSNTKYLIQCEEDDNGYIVCSSLLATNYFINAGSDSSTKPLIYCNGIVCVTTAGTNGYYLSGVKENESYGIIKCSSSTSCNTVSFNNIRKSEHYYINNGGDKLNKAIIKCKKRDCSVVTASEGYFITDDVSTLIHCENPSTCYTITAAAGFYNTAVTVDTGKKIIECTSLAIVTCEIKDANAGFYVAKTSNVLINCNTTPCKPITVTNGIFRSATTQVISSKRDTIPGEEGEEEVSNKERATTAVVYNIISCTNTGCNELSTSELSSIPVCNFNNNKCFINNKVSISTTTVSAISAGSYCTNSDRSVIYFATDTVVIDPEIIDGTTSIYTYTTTTTNCIEALDKYSDSYYTVGSSIYKIGDSSIIQLVATGYYFINVDTNTLVSGNNIELYNNESVKLFKCNDSSCSIIDKPENTVYYADVNKKIIVYNPNSDSYNFAYENEVICIYSNNKCTPRADVKNMEFCITYKGEICLVTNDIKSRETGECYKADTISSRVYGLSQYMYQLNAFSAERIVDNAYFIVSLSTNSTATVRDYSGKNNSLRIYGCVESKCDTYEPEEGVYYYDSVSRYMFRYEDEKWVSPQASGYALISTSPGDVYINRFSLINNRTTIEGRVRSGYYYTIDKEMYECDQDKYQCVKIDNSGYYFTVSGEIYQCVYDSEGLEPTECVKKNCVVGQYYFINSKYYYCSSGYMLNLVTDKTCAFEEKVIVNFPVAFSESYPDKIKSAVENISLINNSTALVTNLNNKYISSVSAVYTNCTYTVEEKESEMDLVCVNNYVAVNNKKDVQICSLANLGYTECVEDEENPEKCNPSGALSQYKIGITLVLSIIVSSILLFI